MQVWKWISQKRSLSKNAEIKRVSKNLTISHSMAGKGLLTLRVYGMLKCATVEEFCFRDDKVRKIETSNKMFMLKSVKLFAGE
jgi:hypothetical protein